MRIHTVDALQINTPNKHSKHVSSVSDGEWCQQERALLLVNYRVTMSF